jgi:putative flavoprotein involved in K+ transport
MSAGQNKGINTVSESFHTIVIGGGQAGLAAGYQLALQNENFIILDERPRTGDAWRNRWDSLHLFTPGQLDGLPGMPFPKPDNYFPSKDEVADYLEEYARQFHLPVRHGVKINELKRNGKSYHISAGTSNFEARNVIVATGPYQSPYTPSFASELDPSILQLHSSAYCNPGQIPAQSILVVGAGNSGAEISLDLSKAGRHVWLAGRDVGQLPVNSGIGRAFGGRLFWLITSKVMSVDTPIGRKMKENALHHGVPLGRARRPEIAAAGVYLTPRVSGVQSGKPKMEDGRILPAEGVIWATGFRPNYGWINLPIFDEQGYPRHSRGVVEGAPGLYFVGLMFQRALSSSLLGGVGADAAYISRQIARKGRRLGRTINELDETSMAEG